MLNNSASEVARGRLNAERLSTMHEVCHPGEGSHRAVGFAALAQDTCPTIVSVPPHQLAELRPPFSVRKLSSS